MPENRSKFTLDELLRAKRSEQPEPEFWVRFDRELKAKQKMLIQQQLASETHLKSPLTARLFKVGAFTATCGIAVMAVYLGFQTPVGETEIAQNPSQEPQATPAPSFTIAEQPQIQQPAQAVGLKEFSTLARHSSPRVLVQNTAQATPAPTQAQLAALQTLASLEETIRGNRASAQTSKPAYQFVSSNGLFETELVSLDQQPEELEGVWDLESALLLGKYADPLTGTLPTSRSNRGVSEIQRVSLSQIDDALSSQGGRSNRAIDALTVRF